MFSWKLFVILKVIIILLSCLLMICGTFTLKDKEEVLCNKFIKNIENNNHFIYCLG